ncbi:putative ribosome-binding factor A [Neorickettsia risticii str. Illinois]|uniref:Ribosome-binding factor A n=1 Tax=Neorickettsia risticii (strain Illinois) TaxID=434131 RepID=C6V513_NEORI|nr:ribosome-binding factor A [Neorickettsia risticii]ACT69478.1 putative ribosome-binding factor A [Neorickettsia risticii str. Illinois]
MQPIKKLRVESLLRRKITEIINKTFGPVAAVSNVEITDNSRFAMVSLQLFNGAPEPREVENGIKAKIGKSLEMRKTPKLHFISVRTCLDALQPASQE